MPLVVASVASQKRIFALEEEKYHTSYELSTSILTRTETKPPVTVQLGLWLGTQLFTRSLG